MGDKSLFVRPGHIFGKHVYNTYEEGLIDAVSSFDFEHQLYNCKDVWNTREAEYLRPGQLSFFDYFVQQYSKVFENTMSKSNRTAAGLGCPPQIFTTNSKPQPNISRLAMTGLPRGRGRKGGKPKRTRSRVTTNTDVVLSRAATMQIPSYFTSTRIGSSSVTVPTENSVTVPAITTPHCSGTQSVSVQVGDNFTNTQSLNVSAEPSSIVYSQNAAGNNVASLSPLPCQVPITNQQSMFLHTQGAATIYGGTS